MLRSLKRNMTYKEIMKILDDVDVSLTELSRYIKGHNLLSYQRAMKFYQKIKFYTLSEMLGERIHVYDGVIDNSDWLYDINILNMLAMDCLFNFQGHHVTNILTAESDGISLATMIADEFDVGLIVAKRSPSISWRDKKIVNVQVERLRDNVDVFYVVADFKYGPFDYTHKSVLLVDDSIITGGTMKALLEICKKCKVWVTGIYVPVATKVGLSRIREVINVPVHCVVVV